MSKLPIGTFINMATVVIGSIIGLLLLLVPGIQHEISEIAIQALAIGILILGIQMSLKIKDEMMLIFIISLILGGILGEWWDLKEMLDSWKGWFDNNLSIGEEGRFSTGLIAAFVLFAASPITIVGAIEEGIQNKRELIIVKSIFDGIMAVVLTSTYGGIGVMVSVLPLLLIQGGLTLLAGKAKSIFTKTIISQISAIGGALLIALALKVLVIDDLKVASLAPAFLVVLVMNWIYGKLGLKA